jgi:hypothetical protein
LKYRFRVSLSGGNRGSEEFQSRHDSLLERVLERVLTIPKIIV